MGRKRNRKGKHLLFCLAPVIFSFLGGCALLDQVERHWTLEEKMTLGQKFRGEGKYEQSLQVYREILAAYPQESPGDLALREIASILIQPGRSQKSYREALDTWSKIPKYFPRSPYTEEAGVWIGLLTEYVDLQSQLEKEKSQFLKTKIQGEEIKARLEDCKNKLEEIKPEQKNPAMELILRNQKLLAHKDFDRAMEENQTTYSKTGNKPPADEALYTLGLVQAHADNPNKDYPKAIAYFNKLLKEFPRSWRAEDARAWIKTIELSERSKQIDLEIEQKRKQLRK